MLAKKNPTTTKTKELSIYFLLVLFSPEVTALHRAILTSRVFDSGNILTSLQFQYVGRIKTHLL